MKSSPGIAQILSYTINDAVILSERYVTSIVTEEFIGEELTRLAGIDL